MAISKGNYRVDNQRTGNDVFCGLMVVNNKGVCVDACDRLLYLKRYTAEQLEQEVTPWRVIKID